MLPEMDAQKLESLRALLMRRIKLEDGALLQELCSKGVITEKQMQAIEKTGGGSKKVGELLDFLSDGDATTLNKFASALRASGYGELADKCYEESTNTGNSGDSHGLEVAAGPSVRPKEKHPEAKKKSSQKADTGTWDFDAVRRECGAVSTVTSSEVPVRGALPASTQVLEGTSQAMSLRCRLAIQKSYREFVQELDVGPTVDYLLSELILTPEESQRIRSKQGAHAQRRALLDLLPQKGQRAFDKFSRYLPTNQEWLLTTLNTHFENITQADLAEAQEGQNIHFREGLLKSLRKNVNKYVQNDPSRILTELKTAPGPYLAQPITAHKVTDGRPREELDTTDVFDLLEKCPPGQRIFIQGTAGMGKSSLCREIGKLWAGGNTQLCNKFRFVLPIPLRLVRSRSLIDIICHDVKLLPSSCKQLLLQEIDLDPQQFLFVLDSFEELGHTEQDEEIIKLIKGEIFEESTVLLTTRPNSQIEKLETSLHCRVHADLQNLNNHQVQSYMTNFPDLDSSSRVNVEKKFGGSFLQRPINLWLLCYVAVTTAGLGLRLPGSQTIILNIIVQHLLLAYLKKKNRPGFQLTDQSPMTLPGHDEVKTMLKEAGRLCYVAVKENTYVIDVTDSVLSREGLMDFGLFAEGSDENTVVLPHQLFKEYLAALYLSAEKTAWDALTSQLENKSITQSPRPCLVDMLRSLHLDNVVRFLVGLSPASAHQLSKLFVIKQGKVRLVQKITGSGIRAIHEEQHTEIDYMHSFFHYELDLLHECSDHATQTTLALALLDADIRPTTDDRHDDYVPNRGSHALLDRYTAGQRERFIGRFYNCQLPSISGRSVLKVLKEGSSFLCDSFVAGFILLHNCLVDIEKLWFQQAHLPVQIIAHHLVDVRGLQLADSTLYRDIAELNAFLNLKGSPPQTVFGELATTSQSVVGLLSVHNVRGLRHLTSEYVMPATRYVIVALCDVTLAEVRQTFPAVGGLWLRYYDDKFFSQQTTLTSVTTLELFACDNVKLTNIRHSFPRLETLDVKQMTVLTDDRLTTWSTLLRLKLQSAHVKHNNNSLNQEQATTILERICPQAEIDIDGYKDEEEAAYTDKYNKAFAKSLMAVHQ